VVAEPLRAAVEGSDDGSVQEPVEHRGGDGGVTDALAPGANGPVRGARHDRTATIAPPPWRCARFPCRSPRWRWSSLRFGQTVSAQNRPCSAALAALSLRSAPLPLTRAEVVRPAGSVPVKRHDRFDDASMNKRGETLVCRRWHR